MNLLLRVVDPHAQPRRRRHAEPPMEWLCAVVPGTEADALAAKNFGEVMRMNVINGKADTTGT